jgi:hypothetical protein
MPRYAAPFTKTNADSVQQLVEILSGATTQRTLWYQFMVGCVETPADALFRPIVHRVTGTATGTSLTPNPLDTQDAACRSSAKHIITADAGSFAAGTEIFRAPVNQRATYQWMCVDGQELVGPATNANGLSLGLSAASTTKWEGTVFFRE